MGKAFETSVTPPNVQARAIMFFIALICILNASWPCILWKYHQDNPEAKREWLGRKVSVRIMTIISLNLFWWAAAALPLSVNLDPNIPTNFTFAKVVHGFLATSSAHMAINFVLRPLAGWMDRKFEDSDALLGLFLLFATALALVAGFAILGVAPKVGSQMTSVVASATDDFVGSFKLIALALFVMAAFFAWYSAKCFLTAVRIRRLLSSKRGNQCSR